MENHLAVEPPEGEEPKSKAQVVADVRECNSKNNQFLQKVGSRLNDDQGSVDVMLQHNWKRTRWQMLVFDQLSTTNQSSWRNLNRQGQGTEEMNKKYANLEAKLEFLLGTN